MKLIDVNVLKEWVENWFTKNRFYHPYAKNNNIPIPELYDILEQMPTIEERKKGKWTKGSDMPPMKHRNGKPKKFCPSLRYCSVCGHEAFDDSDWGEQLFDWCPYCGADTRGGNER